MNKLYFHHVLIASEDLERSRQFYSSVLELEEINRPSFAYPGIWYKIGAGQQQLHIIVRSEATIRRSKSNDPNDIHFALRTETYRDALAWLRDKGFRDDVPAGDLRKMELLPNSLAGWPQIYVLDPDRNIIEFSSKQWVRDIRLHEPLVLAIPVPWLCLKKRNNWEFGILTC